MHIHSLVEIRIIPFQQDRSWLQEWWKWRGRRCPFSFVYLSIDEWTFGPGKSVRNTREVGLSPWNNARPEITQHPLFSANSLPSSSTLYHSDASLDRRTCTYVTHPCIYIDSGRPINKRCLADNRYANRSGSYSRSHGKNGTGHES